MRAFVSRAIGKAGVMMGQAIFVLPGTLTLGMLNAASYCVQYLAHSPCIS